MISCLPWRVPSKMQVTQQDTSENGTWEADVTCTMLLLLKITVLTNTYQPTKARIRIQQSLQPNGSGRRRTEYFVDKSIEFVKKHKDEPFFLNLWPDDMHTPWVPEFKQKERKSWETQEAFAPVLAEMDKQLGRFIKTLDELGVGENTIIIFTSDNGPAPSFKSVRSAYLRGTKNSLYEGGIRMPFIVRYPKKIKAGQVNNESVLCAVDLYPTLCSIAGIKTEKGYKGDGQNYSKVLLGKSEAKRKTDLMWDFGRNKHFGFPGNPYDRSPHLAIRSGKWKLLVNGDRSDAQLYDMEKDKFEKNNIANEHPDLVAKLSKKVCKWYEENKDKGKE